ncbi:IGS10 protein, partial [Rhinopomastus cyanomelas]|nr:IGS10 protein [Rhinopomastus cyanomelas]
EDGRIIILNTGMFTLQTADTFDSGLYHCIGTNHHDADALTFRITVVDPYVERNSVNGAQLSAAVGSTLYLPCTSTAAPDATVSWVLPEHVVLHRSVRNKHIFDNGTLRIRGVTERDSGYFRCVTANRYGVDLLTFQVLVQEDETTLKEKHVAVGGWEEDDGSGHAVLSSVTTPKHPLVTAASLTANQGSAASAYRNQVAQSAPHWNAHRKVMYRRYRDKISRRLRGPRRQFVSSARRIDPQRWAAFLEKARRNSTPTEKQEVARKPPVQVPKFSEVPGDEEETSGDLRSPEEEFMIPVTATVPVQGKAVGSVRTAGPEVITSVNAAWKPSPQDTEAVTALPSPVPQAGSSHSRRPQTYLNPTITPSWKRSDLSQIPTNGIKQPTGATRTSTFFPAMQRSQYSRVSTNQHLKSVLVTPETDKSVPSQNTADKLDVSAESLETLSQVPAMTASEASPGPGPVSFPGNWEHVTPKPPLPSTAFTHRDVQIGQDTATQTHQAQQQYGRHRKISGRRRLVRPGRIPGLEEHRYNFGRPGSVRGSAAVAADVQLGKKPSLPTLSNLSSAYHPFSPEAPLSSPSTMNIPQEHAAGTLQSTVVLGEEEHKPSARPEAARAVVPLVTEGTRDTLWLKLESSAAVQTSAAHTGTAARMPCTAAELAHSMSTERSSTLESDLHSTKPGTSPPSFQRGEIPWEHLVGHAEREVPKKLSEQQRGVFPPAEAMTSTPETTAPSATSPMSPLHITPVTAGGSLGSDFLSLNPPIRYGSGKPEERLPTAHSSSNPATGATEEMAGASLTPTVRPVIPPQTDTRSKTLRAGRKRGQRRKRPPKTSPSPSVTASHHRAASPSANAAMPALTTETRPSSLTPAEALSEATSTVLLTKTPVPQTREAPPHTPTATTSVTGTNIQPATAPPASWIAQSPATLTQTTPRHSKPFRTTRTQPNRVSATSERAQQIRVTTAAGEKSHLKMGRVTHGNSGVQPTMPASVEPRTGAPAATTAITPPSTQHPTTPP